MYRFFGEYGCDLTKKKATVFSLSLSLSLSRALVRSFSLSQLFEGLFSLSLSLSRAFVSLFLCVSLVSFCVQGMPPPVRTLSRISQSLFVFGRAIFCSILNTHSMDPSSSYSSKSSSSESSCPRRQRIKRLSTPPMCSFVFWSSFWRKMKNRSYF